MKRAKEKRKGNGKRKISTCFLSYAGHRLKTYYILYIFIAVANEKGWSMEKISGRI